MPQSPATSRCQVASRVAPERGDQADAGDRDAPVSLTPRARASATVGIGAVEHRSPAPARPGDRAALGALAPAAITYGRNWHGSEPIVNSRQRHALQQRHGRAGRSRPDCQRTERSRRRRRPRPRRHRRAHRRSARVRRAGSRETPRAVRPGASVHVRPTRRSVWASLPASAIAPAARPGRGNLLDQRVVLVEHRAVARPRAPARASSSRR